jgi:hypothetical protein
MTSISASRIPRVVMAGVPMRMPLAVIGGFWSNGDRVLVDRNAGSSKRGLRDFAGQTAREDVNEHHVVVGAAADEPEAGARDSLGHAVAFATI